MTAYLNIGSNIGDRMAHIERAVAAVMALSADGKARVSAPFESEPWGFDSSNLFINVGVAIEIPEQMTPHMLLSRLLETQRSLCDAAHRAPDGSYIDREIDIDLIAVDSLVIDTPELTLPHPRMHLRDFVLRPMAEIAPHWRHPVSGLTCAELADRLRP